jgi:2-C-methyl-D-erythritol 2,4-cyclodiphosphate synthase
MKIGIGFDIHLFEKGKNLVLGGVKIPFEYGLKGHSDGDVVLHAISDAFAGALGKPDIGTFFPDTDTAIKNISSRIILETYISFIKESGMKIANIDIIIIAEKPKIQSLYENIKKNLSILLRIPENNIGLKAKTAEKTGIVGNEKAIACWTVVLLE